MGKKWTSKTLIYVIEAKQNRTRQKGQAGGAKNVQIPRILQNAQRWIVVFGTAPKTARTITSKRHAAAHKQNFGKKSIKEMPAPVGNAGVWLADSVVLRKMIGYIYVEFQKKCQKT